MEFTITITGTMPLLMHNVRLADPLDPIVKARKKITSKPARHKTDEDYEEIARLDFLGGLYLDPDVGPFVPGENIQRCLLDAARLNRLGKQIERGVFIDTNINPLAYKGPRTADALWAEEAFRHRKATKIQNSRTITTRPIFRQWSTQAHGILDIEQMNFEDLVPIVTNAGTLVGLGDWRPRFGRFTATVEKV